LVLEFIIIISTSCVVPIMMPVVIARRAGALGFHRLYYQRCSAGAAPRIRLCYKRFLPCAGGCGRRGEVRAREGRPDGRRRKVQTCTRIRSPRDFACAFDEAAILNSPELGPGFTDLALTRARDGVVRIEHSGAMGCAPVQTDSNETAGFSE